MTARAHTQLVDPARLLALVMFVFLFSQNSACRFLGAQESFEWKPSGFVLADKVGTGWKDVRGNDTWREIYAKPGQTSKNWTEKAEVIELPIAITNTGIFHWNPDSVMNSEKGAAEKGGCSTDMWTILNRDESSILWEWRDIKCAGYLHQHEIVRVVIGRWSLWIISYAIRNRDYSTEEKAELIKDLMRAVVVKKRT